MPCKRQSRPHGNSQIYATKKRANTMIMDGSDSEIPNLLKKQKVDENDYSLIIAGWDRALDKYSPSKEVEISPIKASECNLQHVIPKLKDKLVDLFLWVVNMSEQYYYDNSFLLLSHCKRDKTQVKSMLKRCFVGVDMGFFNNLEDVTLLGEGGFGSVYSCFDRKTKLKFAVKHLSAKLKKYTDHASILLDYMNERNGVIRSMDNPFVVRFYYSLQIKKSGALFLFFEFCIGDLIDFVDAIDTDANQKISEMLDQNEVEIIQELFESKPELLEVTLVYIFEIFCGLDFLVKCNIVHQDIKPDNMMITSNLHLKIGDFGLVYKTRAIHRETNKTLVKADEINISESSNYEIRKPGTIYYQDLELQFLVLENNNASQLKEILTKKKKFDALKMSFDDEVLQPTFLVDTWAAGLCAVMLLFRGFNLFYPEHSSKSIHLDVPKTDISLYIIHLVSRTNIYNNYIKNGLINAGGKSHEELMAFIASIFKPRLTRCESYTNEKRVHHLSKVVNMSYVDMDKVEKLKTFLDRRFNRSTIHLRQLPRQIVSFFQSKKEIQYKTFKNLLDNIEEKRLKTKCPSTMLDIDPGVTINFF